MKYSIKDNKFEIRKSRNLYVGNIIKIVKNEILQADVVIIKSSNEGSFCYLETSNLDG